MQNAQCTTYSNAQMQLYNMYAHFKIQNVNKMS